MFGLVLFALFFCIFLQYFVVYAEKDEENGTHPRFDVRVSPYP